MAKKKKKTGSDNPDHTSQTATASTCNVQMYALRDEHEALLAIEVVRFEIQRLHGGYCTRRNGVSNIKVPTKPISPSHKHGMSTG